MFKKFIILSVALVGLLVISRLMKNREPSKPIIGILQTASHPALDLVSDSFQKSIREHFGSDVDIRVQNAEGVLSQTHTIAKSFHADPAVKLVFTIATPATQVMATVEGDKPIVFAAVTDPKALGILGNSNVTGVRDMIDVAKEVDLIKKLLPKAQKIALVFNPSEINARQLVQQMKGEIERSGLTWIEAGMHQESEANGVVSMAARKADAILCPTDNTVASAIQTIVNQSNKAGIPLFVSDNLLVLKGALAAQGVDYSKSGAKAAELAIKILEGEDPAELTIQSPDTEQIFIRADRVRTLGLTVPSDLQGKVVLIDNEESKS